MADTEVELKAQNLIPDDWNLFLGSSLFPESGRLLFLGQHNLKSLISYWRYKAELLSNHLKHVQESLDVCAKVLEGWHIGSLGSGFDDLVIQDGKVLSAPQAAPSGPYLPPDEAIRRQDSTTWHRCGWCKFGIHGQMSVNGCRLEGNCLLEEHAGFGQTLRSWDTPCIWNRRIEGGDLRPVLRRGLEDALEQMRQQKRQIDDYIRHLRSLVKFAPDKPPFPRFRPNDWFSKGEAVVCFTGDQVTPWRFGHVSTSDTESAEAFISFDEPVETPGYLDFVAGVSVRQPEVLHFREYEYLHQNPDYAELWVKSINIRMNPPCEQLMLLYALTVECKMD